MGNHCNLRQLLDQHGLMANKALGQHFLLDMNITRKIANAGITAENAHVLEIGSGPGSLTRAILEQDIKSLTVVEMDQRFKPLYTDLNANFIFADALTVDLAGSLPNAPRLLVANLPYNVSTPLLVQILRQANQWQNITVLLQYEVAQRMAAPAGSKVYGRLSVLSQAVADLNLLFNIPGSAFVPPPKVKSGLLQITPNKTLPPALFSALEQLTAAGFGMRRKMLKSSLKSVFDDPVTVLESINIDPNARAESIQPQKWLELAEIKCALSH